MVYEIRFHVSSPVIVSGPLHLDGVLAAVHPAAHNLDFINRSSKADDVVTIPLPLDSAKIGDTWVWCCTAADYDDTAVAYHDKFAKRKDYADYHYINARQTPRTGPGRDRMETIYGVSCKYVRFWASTGAGKELERIVRRVRSLGSCRKMGYGAVTDVMLSETGMAWMDCIVRDGIAMRNIPTQVAESAEMTRVPTVPPYWLPSNLVPGVEAGNPCALRDGVWLNGYSRYRKKEQDERPR